MHHPRIQLIILVLIFLFLPECVLAKVEAYTLSGIVTNRQTGENLPFVSVVLENPKRQKVYRQTDAEGLFRFQKLEKGNYRLTVSYIGYQSFQRNFYLEGNQHLPIQLSQNSYTLNDVVVTAAESQGLTSASRIDRKAMEHLQPSSFTDLLALIPGGKTKLPALTQANTIRLRETGKTNSDYAFSSLGTVFVTDGIPTSTNANMQVVRQASSGLTGDADARRNYTNRGVDMRTISTDNIENVEIIRGIASAEYGDLTSGVVIINRKLKATPWEARFKADPYSKLLYMGKGFHVADKDFTLNTSLDYLNAKRDPRNKLENYKRLTGSLRMQKVWKFDQGGRLRWKSMADYTGSFDNDKHDAEILKSKDDRYTSSYNQMSLSQSLAYFLPEKHFLKSLHFDFATTYEVSQIHQDKLVSLSRDQIASITLEEGEHDGLFLPYKYMAHVTVDGKPFTAYAKLKGLFEANTSHIKQIFNVGLEWKADKNFGQGQVYDPSRPITPGTPYRPRNYSDIPAQQQVSAYLQDRMNASIGAHTLEVSAGLRALTLVNLPKAYDLRGKIFLDPRVNLQWRFPGLRLGAHTLHTFISGGYGTQTKFPTLLQLYPDKIYNDIIQLNYFDMNPDYRRVNLRTYVDDPTNFDLQPARNHKWEIRLGASVSGHQFAVTYFQEQARTGFRTTSFVRPYIYKDYDEKSIDTDHLQGRPELDLIPFRQDTILSMYGKTTNGSRLKKEGVEFQYSSNRIKLLKTRFTVNGAWFRSTYSNSQPAYRVVTNKMIGNTPVSNKYIGYYAMEDGTVYESFNTNFMADTYIPKLGLSFSLTAECTWFESSRNLSRNGVPLAYMNTKGEVLPYTEADRHDIYRQWLVEKYNAEWFQKNTVPFYAYFNLKVTKRFGKMLNLALFVDRILDYMPDYTTSSGMTIRRTAKPYFGMELNLTL